MILSYLKTHGLLMGQRVGLIITLLSVVGCMKGPGFFKQDGNSPAESNQDAAKEAVVIPITKVGEVTKGVIKLDNKNAQLMEASDESEIAGVAAEFPPGAIALETEVSMAPGELLALDETLDGLNIDNEFAAAGTSVDISAEVAQDTQAPFTLQIPLPDGGASLLDSDQLSRLVVIYKVKKVSLGKTIVGMLTKQRLVIEGKFVKFSTTHFGSFQAAFLAQPIVEAPKEVEEGVVVAAKQNKSRHVYKAGFRLLSFGNGSQRSEGLTAWSSPMGPAKVGISTTLTSGYRPIPLAEEEQ